MIVNTPVSVLLIDGPKYNTLPSLKEGNGQTKEVGQSLVFLVPVMSAHTTRLLRLGRVLVTDSVPLSLTVVMGSQFLSTDVPLISTRREGLLMSEGISGVVLQMSNVSGLMSNPIAFACEPEGLSCVPLPDGPYDTEIS